MGRSSRSRKQSDRRAAKAKGRGDSLERHCGHWSVSLRFVDACQGLFGWPDDRVTEQYVLGFLLPLTRKKIEIASDGVPDPKHRSTAIRALEQAAQDRIVSLKLREQQVLNNDDLFRFELSDRERLWGFFQGQVFYALWYDAHHAVCSPRPTIEATDFTQPQDDLKEAEAALRKRNKR